ncbi:peptidoglycan DD-metalloendopeptidase family protein [Terasakiella sp. A23]|uniref:murein hydrolase activator EnvC family protein n=1 Tax=Terasakiella sp. FCG-A23 TaxID=3080561 RepID=UPI0029543284|nr:peptidoglycan DD-metalloendopeptidase family protein [Terasakiella sp. A23]MDV7338163.1 peptidoglycan DD-metalloendopeptidase family protein [Terasakiella sp. A23]
MRHNKSRWLLSALMVPLFFGAPEAALGATKQDELKELQRDIQDQKKRSSELENKSKVLQDEARALRAELIALSQSVQQREANVTHLEIAIRDLAIEEKQARLELEKRYALSIDTLMALQRLALNPPEALIASPQDPGDMVRSAILLRSIVPQIQEDATVLRKEVEAYAKKRTLLENQKKSLSRANINLDDERRRLNVLIKEKKALSARYVKDSKAAQKRVAALSKKAKSLKGLLNQLERDRKAQAKKKKAQPRIKATPESKPQTARETEEAEIVLGKPPRGKPIAKAKGKLSRPATGRVVMKFGAREKLGGKHKGISIKTRKGAQIVATYDGQIAFAGPFRGYKQLLIIDHGDGYHTLLTGMEHIDVSVGQWLLSGEPVGVMSSNGSSNANLYFELRKNGAPINPLPWMRRQNAKARG